MKQRRFAKNLQYFMEKCLVETNAHFLGKFRDSHKNGERWPKMISLRIEILLKSLLRFSVENKFNNFLGMVD